MAANWGLNTSFPHNLIHFPSLSCCDSLQKTRHVTGFIRFHQTHWKSSMNMEVFGGMNRNIMVFQPCSIPGKGLGDPADLVAAWTKSRSLTDHLTWWFHHQKGSKQKWRIAYVNPTDGLRRKSGSDFSWSSSIFSDKPTCEKKRLKHAEDEVSTFYSGSNCFFFNLTWAHL